MLGQEAMMLQLLPLNLRAEMFMRAELENQTTIQTYANVKNCLTCMYLLNTYAAFKTK